MADVRVDPAALEELARHLASLRAEFEGLDALMGDHQRTAGHREVADRLEDFAENWSDARPRIVERLERLAGMASGAARFYRDREAALAAKMGQAAEGPES